MGVDVETGLPPRGLKIRDVKAQEEALAKAQKARRRRIVADTLGLALVDVLAFYRDVLLLQVGSPLDPVHSDLGREAAREAARTTPEQTLRRIAVIDDTHRLVTDPHAQANTLLAVEAMAVALGSGVPLPPR
jgi:DNA polymerase-3 subunit delta'